MLDPLNDGHIELKAEASPHPEEQMLHPGKTARFRREFTTREIEQLFKTTEETLIDNCFPGGLRRLRPGCFATAGLGNSATFGSSSWKALASGD